MGGVKRGLPQSACELAAGPCVLPVTSVGGCLEFGWSLIIRHRNTTLLSLHFAEIVGLILYPAILPGNVFYLPVMNRQWNYKVLHILTLITELNLYV